MGREACTVKPHLLISVNNTHTKVARCPGEEELEMRGTFATGELTEERVHGWLEQEERAKLVVLGSVVPKLRERIEFVVKAQKKDLLVIGPDMDLGFDLSEYPRPETIGADRLANMAFAAGKMNLPALVIDLGTAVTFDVLDVHRKFRGGVIAPGLRMFPGYLHERTAQLPSLEEGELDGVTRALNAGTRESMAAGTRYGFTGMVRSVWQALAKEVSQPLHIALTGGDHRRLANWLEADGDDTAGWLRDEDLTMKGLARLGRLNA